MGVVAQPSAEPRNLSYLRIGENYLILSRHQIWVAPLFQVLYRRFIGCSVSEIVIDVLVKTRYQLTSGTGT